jgi:hypothetical protein
LALSFATAADCDAALQQTVIVKDLPFKPVTVPAIPPQLLKLTLDRVPSVNKVATTEAIRETLNPWGRVVEVVPLTWGSTGVLANTWHVTLDVCAPDTPGYPPTTLKILDVEVLVDIPGKRYTCRHCKTDATQTHRADCRNGQRMAAKTTTGQSNTGAWQTVGRSGRSLQSTARSAAHSTARSLVPGLAQTQNQRKKAAAKRSKQKKAAKQATSTSRQPSSTSTTTIAKPSTSNNNKYISLSDDSDVSDDDLDNLMEGVAVPSKPDGVFASRHAPGANFTDDDTMPTGTTTATDQPAVEGSPAESVAMDTAADTDPQPVVVIADQPSTNPSRSWANIVSTGLSAPFGII